MDLFDRILSFKDIFPEIGKPGFLNLSDKSILKQYYSDYDELLDIEGKNSEVSLLDPDRILFSAFCTTNTLDYITNHEMHHAMSGHYEFEKKYDAEKISLHAIELHADKLAFINCFNEILHRTGTVDLSRTVKTPGGPINLDPYMKFYNEIFETSRWFLFAISTLYLMLESDEKVTNSSHPTSNQRLGFILITLKKQLSNKKHTAKYIDYKIKESYEVSMKAYKSVTGRDVSIQPSYNKDLENIILQWERIRPLMEPYSHIKLMPLLSVR